MKFKCAKSFKAYKYEDEERDDEPIGTMLIEKGSLWEMREYSWDYDVLLDDCNDARWIGLSKEFLRKMFIRAEESQ